MKDEKFLDLEKLRTCNPTIHSYIRLENHPKRVFQYTELFYYYQKEKINGTDESKMDPKSDPKPEINVDTQAPTYSKNQHQTSKNPTKPPITVPGTSKDVKISKSDDKNKKTTLPICKFYQKGKCRHNENCRFEHPKICYKFRAFGLKTDNEKGCESSCSFFHPNACKDSLKSKNCPREECRFYHLKGTKKE